MTTKTILARLGVLGLPFAQMEFKDTKKNPAPNPPFIVWLQSERARGADEKSNLREVTMSVELYTTLYDETLSKEETDKKRAQLEKQVESLVLQDTGYQKFVAPISSERMIQTAYEINFLQKEE